MGYAYYMYYVHTASGRPEPFSASGRIKTAEVPPDTERCGGIAL